MPSVGACTPVISLKRVVLPLPFRPTIPQRSPRPTVKVIPRKTLVAPNSTPTLDTEIWVKNAAHSNRLRDTARLFQRYGRPEGSLIADTVGDWEPRGAMFANFLPVSSPIFATQSCVRAAIAL